MRALGACLLIGLLLVPAAQGVQIGHAESLSEYPAQLGAPARGDGFTAWIDVRAGAPQVLVHFDGGDTVRLVDHKGSALQHLAAAGDWVAWSQQTVAGRLPGEQSQRTNWDLVVYDLQRRAVVYESASADRNETSPALASGRIVFLDDATGPTRVMQAALRGPDAFQPRPLAPAAGRQGAPSVDGDATVFLQDAEGGTQLVRVQDGQVQVLAQAAPGQGLGTPHAWAGHVAWPEYAGASSALRVWDAATGQAATFTFNGSVVMQAVGDGSATVVELRQEQRSLWAWCPGEDPVRVGNGVLSRPVLSTGTLAYLVQVGGEQHVAQRTLTCGGDAGAARDSPASFLGAVVAVLAGLAWSRRR